DLHFDRMKKYDEEKRELKRKGVRSGMDEALHQITSETMVEVLKENLDLRAALKNYVLLTLRETLLPLLKGEGR
ncbi:MAG: hypothetical protein ACRD1Z_04950, partial [Vicinamibacteria bacterium]